MKLLLQFILFILLTSLTSCTNRERKTSRMDNRQSQQDSSYNQTIKRIFNNWQADKIKSKEFWADDSCYPGHTAIERFNGTIDEMWGFPDSSEIHYSFADINKDNLPDGLVTFSPAQCDGGNGSMWEQMAVLIVSHNGTYSINDTLLSGMSNYLGKSSKGFIRLKAIDNQKLIGTYFEFKEGDGHCCPSVERPISIQYDKLLINQ